MGREELRGLVNGNVKFSSCLNFTTRLTYQSPTNHLDISFYLFNLLARQCQKNFIFVSIEFKIILSLFPLNLRSPLPCSLIHRGPQTKTTTIKIGVIQIRLNQESKPGKSNYQKNRRLKSQFSQTKRLTLSSYPASLVSLNLSSCPLWSTHLTGLRLLGHPTQLAHLTSLCLLSCPTRSAHLANLFLLFRLSSSMFGSLTSFTRTNQPSRPYLTELPKPTSSHQKSHCQTGDYRI